MITIHTWHRKGYKKPLELVYDLTLQQYYIRGFVRSQEGPGGMEVVHPIQEYNGSKAWINRAKQLLHREFGLDSTYSKQVISYFLMHKKASA